MAKKTRRELLKTSVVATGVVAGVVQASQALAEEEAYSSDG